VVTSGTQPPAALVTLDNSRVLRMISAIQHYYSALALSAAAGMPPLAMSLRLVLPVLVGSAVLFW
jgi:hypothetical protein